MARLPVDVIPRARTLSKRVGLMKAVIAADSDKILGFTMLGAQAGEVLAVVQMAMLGGLPYTALLDGILAHPTMAEGLNMLFGSSPQRTHVTTTHAPNSKDNRMPLTLHEASIAVMIHGFHNLAGVLERARLHAKERSIDEAQFLDAQLFDDMMTMRQQVQRASDTAKRAAIRVAGVADVSMPDDEASFADLSAEDPGDGGFPASRPAGSHQRRRRRRA